MNDAIRQLIGTPWKRNGNEPGVGIDCWHLAQRVANLMAFPIPDAITRGEIEQVRACCFEEVRDGSPLRPGDVLTFKAGDEPWESHCVVLIDERHALDVGRERPVHRIRVKKVFPYRHAILRPVEGGELLLAQTVGAQITPQAVGWFLLQMAAATAIGIGTSYLLAPDEPRIEPDSARDNSATYSWSGIRTQRERGAVIHVAYGEHVLGGQVIQQYSRADQNGLERLYMLLALGHGEFEEICGFKADFDRVAASDIPGYLTLNDNDVIQYEGVEVSARMGTVDQTHIPGFQERISEYSTNNFPLVNTSGSDRTGIDDVEEAYEYQTATEVEMVEMNIRFPRGLQRVTDRGASSATSVVWRYRYRRFSEPDAWSDWISVTVRRRHTSLFRTTRRQVLPDLDSYVLQIQRVTPDFPDTGRKVGDMELGSINEISGDAYIYPGIALLAVEAAATDQLSGNTPNVKVRCKCRKIPVWDGVDPVNPSFTDPVWSQNPAYIARDIMTDQIWGLGRFLDTEFIDDESIVEWAQFCDEDVEIPSGTTEDRCQFDGVFDKYQSGWDMLSMIGRTARATPIVVGNQISFRIDKPREITQLFTDGNIEVGSFSAIYEDRDRRPNAISVQYLDRDDFYRQTPYEREDTNAAAAGDMYRPEAINLFGITRRTQIAREALLRLSVNRNALKTITFTSSVEAISCEIGDVVSVSHNVPQWGWSGRVKDATPTTVTLNRDLEMRANVTYLITVRFVDDTTETVALVPPGPGNQLVPLGTPIETATPWTSIPVRDDPYTVGRSDGQGIATEMVIKNLSLDSDLNVSVSGSEYFEEVYADDLIIVDQGDGSGLDDPTIIPGDVQNLFMKERRAEVDPLTGTERIVLELFWEPPIIGIDVLSHYFVYYRAIGESAWTWVPTSFSDTYADVGAYIDDDTGWEFTVVAVSISGAKKNPNFTPRVSTELGFSGDPPDPPINAQWTRVGNVFTLTWDPPATGAAGYEVREPATIGVPNTYEDGILIGRTVETSWPDLVLVPEMYRLGSPERHWFFVRSYNEFGRHSRTGLVYLINNTDVPYGTFEQYRSGLEYDLSTDGTLTNLTWNVTKNRLELVDPSQPGIWESQQIDTTLLDTGGIYTKLYPDLKYLNDDGLGPTWDDMDMRWISPYSDVWTWDGPARPAYPDDAFGFKIEIRVSDDDVIPNWDPYQEVAYFGLFTQTWRWYQIKITLTTDDDINLLEPALRSVITMTGKSA